MTGNSAELHGLAATNFFFTATFNTRRNTRNSWCTVAGFSSPFHDSPSFRPVALTSD